MVEEVVVEVIVMVAVQVQQVAVILEGAQMLEIVAKLEIKVRCMSVLLSI